MMKQGPSPVVLLTRTHFAEPPRLRQQVARLLADRGHPVLFVEKPRTLRRSAVFRHGPISLASSGQLIHHQLRVARPCSLANAAFVRRSLRALAIAWPGASVINFNYDYWMARELWPGSRFVTVINDDFRRLARPWAAKEARWAQRRTLAGSDMTLAVSYPLVRQCLEDTPDVELFLPWARDGYHAPSAGLPRRDLLLWGYLDQRTDWNIVEGLAGRGVTIHVAGPIRGSRRIARVLKSPRVVYHGVAPLSELGAVLDLCAASILPYALEWWNGEMTISNRAFELLGRGLPLLYADFPELLPAPPGVIHRCRTLDDYHAAWKVACSEFELSQPGIQAFLAEHSADVRYQALASACGWSRR